MQLTHRFTVPATVEETWAAFNDIEDVAGCFPGAVVTSVEGDTFQGSCKVKLGPIALVYNGSGTFVEKDESSHTMKIEAKGKDKRGNGTAGANVHAAMTGSTTDGGASTEVEVVTDLNITGKPAQFGRGVMQDVSDKLLGQFVDCLQSKVGGTAEAADAASATAATAAATESSAPGAVVDPAAPAAGAPATAPSPDPSAPTAPTAPTAPSTPSVGHADTEHRAPAPQPAAAAPPTAKVENDALDLGATVLPILAKAYWKQAVAVVVAIVVVVLVVKKVL